MTSRTVCSSSPTSRQCSRRPRTLVRQMGQRKLTNLRDLTSDMGTDGLSASSNSGTATLFPAEVNRGA